LSRMFQGYKTWNPIVGCKHDCRYCWARRMAQRQKHRCIECFAFVPHLHRERLSLSDVEKQIFVCSMGDMWGDWVDNEWIRKILEVCRSKPKNCYLFLTKNPERYHEFLDELPPNSILGVTIETNRNTRIWSINAPNVTRRYEAMLSLPSHVRKAVSIEPIMDFDEEEFIEMIKNLKPSIVWIGYDNYNNKLPEPPLSKTFRLIDELNKITYVETKTIRRRT